MKRQLAQIFSRQNLPIIAPLIFFLFAVLFLCIRYVPDYFRPDWSTAFHQSPEIVRVALRPVSNAELWPSEAGHVAGARGHWLMSDYRDSEPERLWYDGEPIAISSVGFSSYILSPDGRRYAYTEKLVDATDESQEQLVVDGEIYAVGGRMTVLYVPDSGDPYYMCDDCGQGAGNALWHGSQRLASLEKDERNSEDVTAAFIVAKNQEDYCFINDTLGTSILLSGKRIEQHGWSYCSPSARVFVSEESRNTFPIGNKSVLFVNNKKAAEGNISDVHIDDNSLLSYAQSNGSGGGLIVWHGKRYTYHKYMSNGNWIVSPSQNNLLISLTRDNKEVWLLNGQVVNNIRDDDSLYLDDETLYIYRFMK